MSLTTTPRRIGSSGRPSTVHDNHTRSSSDRWQVSRYFPIRPAVSAPRWSRVSDLSAQPATALSDGRALGAINAAGEAPLENFGRPVAERATKPCVGRPQINAQTRCSLTATRRQPTASTSHTPVS